MSREPDIIVVGAGVAGLSAARELSRLGLVCTVIEGSHRIGGRAYSEEIAPGVWFDLGCAWLVGGAANPFAAIADTLDIALCKDKSDRFKLEKHRFHRNGEHLNPYQLAACLRYYDDSFRAIMDAARQDQDIAISDVVDMDNEFAPPFLGSIASGWGLDIDQLSTVDFASATGELGYQAYRGYGNLVAAWGADVAVSLNTCAERIVWTGQGVRVETPKGPITGRAALITVSTGVLASGEIKFAPGLPDWKMEAINHLPMGTENKIGLHFDTDIFGPEGRGFYTTWNADDAAAKVDASVMGLNTAAVFVGGRHAIWLEKQGQQALKDFAVNRVADIFGNDTRKHLDRAIATAWSTEPWARGSWACARPGQAHQRANLARPVDERLFFAGEATLYGGQGTCHGAYESGIRAAREVAEHVNHGKLS
jgi:monoamine oxidase